MDHHSKRSPLVTFKKISKDFGGIPVLKEIDLTINPAEILGLVGENGAGKSTLMKILTGIYPSGSFQGDFLWEEKPCHLKNIESARQLGINMVFQELSLVPQLSLVENLYLGSEIVTPFGVIRKETQNRGAMEILKSLGMTSLSQTKCFGNFGESVLQSPVSGLGMGQRQMLEFGKALRKKMRLLILDEPTAALSPQEADILLNTLRSLRDQGVAIIYISHRLQEILEISDRICILRDGRAILTAPKESLTETTLITHMVGRQLTQRFPPALAPSKSTKISKQLLRVENLDPFFKKGPRTRSNPASARGISFSLFEGEILGLAGLMGAGRTELALSLFGLFGDISSYTTKHTIYIDDVPVKISSPIDAMKQGMALVPEERKRSGLILSHSVADNLSLAYLKLFSRWGIVNFQKQREKVESLMQELNIKPFNPDLPVKNLSGGNQQKVCFGKWLIQKPKILILDEPTRGVDIGAKFDIYQKMRALTAEGVGILMISSDMEEILGMSDRVMVLSQGHLSGILEKSRLTSQAVMELAIPQHHSP